MAPLPLALSSFFSLDGITNKLTVSKKIFKEEGLMQEEPNPDLASDYSIPMVWNIDEEFAQPHLATRSTRFSVKQVLEDYGMREKENIEKGLMELFRDAINENAPLKQYSIGWLYNVGMLLVQDNLKAIQWYERAAENEYLPAQYNLGAMYDGGVGSVEQDESKSIRWYLKAAKQGYAKAQFNLAVTYEKKGELKKAEEWYLKAAEQKLPSAHYNLGVYYLERNERRKAAEWSSNAAELEHLDGCFNLAVLYRDGYGVSRDVAKAVEYFQWAARRGDQDAAAQVSSLTSQRSLT